MARVASRTKSSTWLLRKSVSERAPFHPSTHLGSLILHILFYQALCQQRLLDWQARFSKFGLRCVEVTGDNSGLRDVASAQLILTTPGEEDPSALLFQSGLRHRFH